MNQTSLSPSKSVCVESSADVHPVAQVSQDSLGIGLLGLAVHALLFGLSLADLVAFPPLLLSAALVGTGLFQLVTGLQQWRQGDGTGAAILGALGLFWISLLPLVIFPLLGLATAPEPLSLTVFLGPWGVFALAFSIAGDEMRPALRTLFAMLALFILLLGAAAATSLPALRLASGHAALSVGLCAIYALLTRRGFQRLAGRSPGAAGS